MDAPARISDTVGVRFEEVGKVYHFDVAGVPDLMPGQFVIVETSRGVQMGQVTGFVPPEDLGRRKYKAITRIANARDTMMQQAWRAKELDALISCREKAAQIGKYDGVKFIKATYNFDGSLLVFSFTAEQRVDASALARELRKTFRCRVEMRQVGPRDAAKIMSGYGACGEPRCCSTFLTEFSPISIKMAKAQGVSLNPSEITGMCGRLRCCLVYEYEQYVEARKKLPKMKKRVGTPYGEGKVVDIHALKDSVTVDVGGQRHEVFRTDLEPLEEWEALKEKSAKGCGKKNGGGACECGARK